MLAWRGTIRFPIAGGLPFRWQRSCRACSELVHHGRQYRARWPVEADLAQTTLEPAAKAAEFIAGDAVRLIHDVLAFHRKAPALAQRIRQTGIQYRVATLVGDAGRVRGEPGEALIAEGRMRAE